MIEKGENSEKQCVSQSTSGIPLAPTLSSQTVIEEKAAPSA
jgi:hypothetical protein